MAALLSLLHLSQACLSVYALYLSTLTIPKLQRYEDAAEEAAKYSSTVEHQLGKTRTTQASGAITTSISLATSLSLLALASKIPVEVQLLLSIANFGTTIFAHSHLHQFWQGRAKVPFVHDYNDAIAMTNQMATALAGLAATWAICAFVVFGFLMSALGESTSGEGRSEL